MTRSTGCSTTRAARFMRTSAWRLAVAAAAIAVAGCDGLFDVDNPTDILEEDLANPELLETLANSAEGVVADVYDQIVITGGLPGDGVINASTNQADLRLDRGLLEGFNEGAEGLYNNLSAARWTASEVTRRLVEQVDNPQSDLRVARAKYWDAVARMALADIFEEVPFDGGAPQTPAAVYEGAISLLEAAVQGAQGSSPEYVAAAEATMARAYRSLYFERGRDQSLFDQAALHARRALETKPDFITYARFQTPGSSNNVFRSLSEIRQVTMASDYADLTDPASGMEDPRIQHGPQQGTGVVGDAIYPQLKYDNASADIPVSRWQEAQLILAEHALLTGDVAGAVARINAVRAAAGLPAFTSSSASTVREQLLYERKAEFWLEARRWPDMRYYEIIDDRWFPEAKQAGLDRRLPVSLRERLANPNYK